MKPSYTLGMLLVLVALMAYVLTFERRPQDPNDAPGQASKENILSVEKSAIQALSLDQNAPALSLNLNKLDEQWVLENGQSADQSRMDMLLTRLSPWQAADVLIADLKAEPIEASEFGLEPPELILRVTTSERTETLKIGAKTPTSSGYYALKEGDSRLYLVHVNVPEDLKRLLTEPPVPTPDLAEEGAAVPTTDE